MSYDYQRAIDYEYDYTMPITILRLGAMTHRPARSASIQSLHLQNFYRTLQDILREPTPEQSSVRFARVFLAQGSVLEAYRAIRGVLG